MKQKTSHDTKAKTRTLEVGDSVLARNYAGQEKWLNVVIENQSGPVSYRVLVNGQFRRCHLDQLKLKLVNFDSKIGSSDIQMEDVDLPCVPEVVDVPRADVIPGQSSQLPVVRSYSRRHNRGQPPWSSL